MKLMTSALFASFLLSTSAHALAPDILEKLHQQSANVKSANDVYVKAVEKVAARMKAEQTKQATKHEDALVLAAAKVRLAASEEMLNFYLAYEDEFRLETKKYDEDIAGLRVDVEKTRKTVTDAERQGGIEAIENRPR